MTKYTNNQHPSVPTHEKISIWMPLMLALALAGGSWMGFHLGSQSHQYAVVTTDNSYASKIPRRAGKVEEILRFIDARYLKDVEQGKLEDAAIQGLLKKLDPHSSYIPAAELQQVNESLAGGFEGIGVEFSIIDDTVYVVGVIPEGPSDIAGMQTGDKIIMIGDSLIAGNSIKNKGVIDKLKGKRGSPVTVKVKRSGLAELKPITITRDQIPMYSVDVAYMLDATTGFIKINRFSGKTSEEFLLAVRDLVENEGMEHLVIDLRHNPGGYLNAATEILNELFRTKTNLVYTAGRSYKRKEYYSNGQVHFPINKVAVLVDEGSASASEILAGAIQDNDRGIIIGRRSFGKGLVQEQYDLSDGSALRLTVARYYTPSGRLIQKPYKNDDDNYSHDLDERYKSGELFYRDSIKIEDSTEYRTVGNRVVYGGGGIIPDVFIPLDTITHNSYFNLVSSYIPQFTYKYMDVNRSRLNVYETYERFNEQFQVDNKLFKDFVDYTVAKKIPKNNEVLLLAKYRLSLLIKAYVAQQLFREEGFYKTLHQNDDAIKQALKEIMGESRIPSAMN